jgi:cyclic dehypoxanthinyl futalosine synthase
VSRLFIDNIQHFQTSWVTQGKKIGQAGLRFGADDMGSIMIEENVVAAAGTSFRMTQDEMEHLIATAGYQPRQRTNLYERWVTREDTAATALRYRGSLTAPNIELASSGGGGHHPHHAPDSGAAESGKRLPVVA